MDRLWSPWRYSYIAGDISKARESDGACVFCDIYKNRAADDENFVVYRGVQNFVILNIFPYTSGHSMVVANKHIGDLDFTPAEITNELLELTKRCQTALRTIYKPDGFNIGINQGNVAGAGIAGHLHMHIVPRWVGDANFMTTIGETRVLPESLQTTWQKLKAAMID